MKNRILIISLAVLLVCSLLAAVILLNDGREDELPTGELYHFPLSVGEETYVVSVRSNYSSAPEVGYSGILKAVWVDFKGAPEKAFCNVTIPNDLIWGELYVIDKIYELNEDDYIQSSNSTHNSIYFTFDHTAYTKHFEVMGIEGRAY